MRLSLLLASALGLALAAEAYAKAKDAGDDLFTGAVPSLRLEISPEGIQVLRRYHQVWRQERPERIDVRARVREGEKVYEDVAVHLKGTYTFQQFDAKPSLTLNFDKFVPGQHFHGLSKIHLNNSVQDETSLCEQFAREMFKEAGIVAPRATPALVQLNGRDLGVCVLVEGANKSFVERNFNHDGKGNLYDGGSGTGDVNKELHLMVGQEPPDRADLKALAEATREPDAAQRLARLEKVLDVEQFITFAAIEDLLVHWDGYSIGCNNYRVFHDPTRDKFFFMPHGMDQLFGTSNSPEMSLTPQFKGLVAKALFSIPEARQRYLQKIEKLSTTTFTVDALNEHLDRLAKRLRHALDENQRQEFDRSVRSLKTHIAQRCASVTRQLGNPAKPLRFGENGLASLTGWHYRPDSSYMAQGTRVLLDRHEVLRVNGTGAGGTGGSWRLSVLLDAGHYQFMGMARTRGADANQMAGILLRISGETNTDNIGQSEQWKSFKYEFDLRGTETVELVCEFRGPAAGVGEFDARSLRLAREEPEDKLRDAPDVDALRLR